MFYKESKFVDFLVSRKLLIGVIFILLLLLTYKVSGAYGISSSTLGNARFYIDGPDNFSAVTENYKIMLDSGPNNIGFVSVKLTFDPNKVVLINEIQTTEKLMNRVVVTTMNDANSTGSVDIVLGLSANDFDNLVNGETEIASLSFSKTNTNVSGDTRLSFNLFNMQAVDLVAQELELTNEDKTILFQAPTQTPSISIPVASPTSTPGLSPVPTDIPSDSETALSLRPKGNFTVNQRQEVDLYLITDTDVVGADARISFDSRHLNVVEIKPGNILQGKFFSEIDNELGKLNISQTQEPPNTFNGEGILATIVIEPIAIGDTDISFDFVIGSKSESNVISSLGTDVLKKADSLTLEINQSVSLQLSLLTSSEDTSIGHKVTGTLFLEDGDWIQSFTTNEEGKAGPWQLDAGLVGVETPFYVKVPGYLKKRVALNLENGLNVLELGNLTPGDLNDDMVIDASDLDIMYLNWFKNGLPDFNKDSTVNVYDFFLLTKSFF